MEETVDKARVLELSVAVYEVIKDMKMPDVAKVVVTDGTIVEIEIKYEAIPSKQLAFKLAIEICKLASPSSFRFTAP